MLAKFENGNLLEVFLETEKEDELYCYAVWDENGDIINSGWTGYVELYPSSVNWIDYILDVCNPDGVSGKYDLLDFKDADEYFDSLK